MRSCISGGTYLFVVREPGRRTFVRLVRQRYGRQASARIRETKDFFAGILLAGAAEEVNAGNFRGALAMLCRSLRYRPFLVFNPYLAVRLIKVRNVRLIAKSLIQYWCI